MRIYSMGVPLDQLAKKERERVSAWEAAQVSKLDNGTIMALTPVFTEEDASELASWSAQLTEQSVAIVTRHIAEYRQLADGLAEGAQVPPDYLITILLCAHTLDVGTLEQLHRKLLGEPPDRAGTGHYFFWGQTARDPGRYAAGVNSYSLGEGALVLSVITSPGVRRRIPKARSVSIPVFSRADMERVQGLCTPVSGELAEVFCDGVKLLDRRVARCSFARCSRPDYLCMLFHIGYAHAADALAEAGLLPKFPQEPEDAWGLSIRPRQ